VITELEAEMDGKRIPFLSGLFQLSNQASEHLRSPRSTAIRIPAWAVTHTAKCESDAGAAAGAARPDRCRFGDYGPYPPGFGAAARHHRPVSHRSQFGRVRVGRAPKRARRFLRLFWGSLRTAEGKRTAAQRAAIAQHFEWASPEAQAELNHAARLELKAALYEAIDSTRDGFRSRRADGDAHSAARQFPR